MPTDDADVAVVVRLELELLDPAIRADHAAVRARLHPEFREVGASGRLWDVATTVSALGQEGPGYVVNVARGPVLDYDALCGGLRELGVGDGDRVATFAWNTQRHLEAYMAAPCMGAVLHTLNIRLFPEQLVYIANHAEDRVIIVDDSLVPLLAKISCPQPWLCAASWCPSP